jgi:MFS family permease
VTIEDIELGGNPPRSAYAVAGVRDAVGLFVILSSIGFNVLLVLAIMPVMSIIGGIFDARPDDPVARLLVSIFGGKPGALISQLLETMSGIGIMLGGPMSGWLAERTGTRNLLLLALALYGAAGTACMGFDDVGPLLILRFVQGLGASGIAVSTYSLVSERFEGAARSRMIGFQGVFVSAAGFISLPIAGMIADKGGWHAPFALYLSAFGMLLLAWISVPANLPVAGSHKAAPTLGSLKPLLPLYAMAIPLYLAATMANLHISFVLAADGITKATGQSYVMLASSVLYLLGGLAYGAVIVRLGARWMLCLILGLMSLSGLIIGSSHDVWIMTVGNSFSGLSAGFLIPFMTNQVVNRAGPAARSRALGFFYMATYIGNFLNPPIMTPLRQALGNHQIFLVVGLVLAAAALLQAVSRRSPVLGTT